MGEMTETTAMPRRGRRSWPYRHPRLAPAIVFTAVTLATLAAATGTERSARHERQLAMERDASDIAAALQQRAAENVATLNAAATLFSMHQIVNRQSFSSFVLALADNGGGIGTLGMGWAPAMSARVSGAYEQAMRTVMDLPDFAIFPKPRADQLVTPVTYLAPDTARNRLALGYDMYSNPVRRDAMDRAFRDGRPAASGKLHLLQDRDNRSVAGFIVYMPVFNEASPTRRLKGFVYLPFQAEDFARSALRIASARGLSIELFDQSVNNANLLAGPPIAAMGNGTITRPLNVAGRDWILRLDDPGASRLNAFTLLVLSFGLILAVLLALITQLVLRRVLASEDMLDRLSREAAIRTSLTRELTHRVKNTLANVLSIMALTRRRARDIDEFAETLGGRIRALSATHDLLSQRDWTAADIGAVVSSELAPYMSAATDADGQVALSGPAIFLAPNDAMSLGLAIHELATNAAKYGALSVGAGQVAVVWRLMKPGLAEVYWRESGGPEVEVPNRRGFGRELIERIVAQELGSAVDMRFEPGGVECRMRVPVRRPGDFAIRESRPA
jgi:two-component sensor histidine kinase/sensor domain CHASE-containing protein